MNRIIDAFVRSFQAISIQGASMGSGGAVAVGVPGVCLHRRPPRGADEVTQGYRHLLAEAGCKASILCGPRGNSRCTRSAGLGGLGSRPEPTNVSGLRRMRPVETFTQRLAIATDPDAATRIPEIIRGRAAAQSSIRASVVPLVAPCAPLTLGYRPTSQTELPQGEYTS